MGRFHIVCRQAPQLPSVPGIIRLESMPEVSLSYIADDGVETPIDVPLRSVSFDVREGAPSLISFQVHGGTCDVEGLTTNSDAEDVLRELFLHDINPEEAMHRLRALSAKKESDQ